MAAQHTSSLGRSYGSIESYMGLSTRGDWMIAAAVSLAHIITCSCLPPICKMVKWSLRAMRSTRVIMQCTVLTYTTTRLTYEALGSVAEPPCQPAAWRRAPSTGHRFASRLRLRVPIVCKNKRQSALGVSGGERGSYPHYHTLPHPRQI